MWCSSWPPPGHYQLSNNAERDIDLDTETWKVVSRPGQRGTAAGGGQSAPIFFTIDEDINRDTWNRLALQWFRGINSVLGVQRTGVYGGINVCQWAAADGVIGSSSTAGRRWAWQTRAWSGNQVDAATVLYQRVVSTASNPGPLVGGLEVDVNDVLAPDCGQWNLHSWGQPNRNVQ